MKKTTRRLSSFLLIAALILGLSGGAAFASPTLDGRDPDAPVSLTIHHNVRPDGTITPGTPTGQLPSPIGAPVAGSEWMIQLITVPTGTTWDGNMSSIQESWLGEPIIETTGTNGQAVFKGIPQGVYLVTELTVDVPGYGAIADPFLVSLPYFWDGEWVYDVHAFPKDPTRPVTGKFLENVELINGDVVITWVFAVDIRLGLDTIEPIAETSAFIRMVDPLDPRLTFLPNSVSIEYDTTTGPQTLSSTGFASNVDGSNVLNIDIIGPGRDAIAANGEVGGDIRITFQTRANINSHEDLGLIENSAVLWYSGHPELEIEDVPYTTVYGIRLTKVNTAGDPLGGAVFQLFAPEDIEGTGTAARVRSGAVPIMTATSGTDGIASFYGLPEGTYFLYEYAAPAGYTAIPYPMQVEVNAEAVGVYPDNYIISVTVTNSASFNLPLTGGMGTILFTAVGLVLIGSAVLLIIVVGKKKKKENH
ncbi:MAG: SpaH/EbpB family LPXTG-anchored major pilin [Oscillospiraceae bacterium]|nr:SpaH/EbpB family LPXTG-anchored major pilin [Oscillospiraceae bacterium]